MAKQAYVYSGTDWVPLASEVTNLSNYYTKGEVDNAVAPMGLVHLNTTSFSAVASQAVTFASATYKNYKVIMRWTQSAASTLSLRVRSGATDYTGAEYNDALFFIRSAGTSNGIFASGQNLTSNQLTGTTNGFDSGSTIINQAEFLISNLYEATSTTINQSLTTADTTGNTLYVFGSHRVRESTSRDGLNFILTSNNMTGTIQIFGVNE